MQLLRTHESKEAGFNLYFLGYLGDYKMPKEEDLANGVNPLAGKEGLLELTWNYGTEKEEGQVYHSGNEEPQGFGHICLSVDDLDEACKFMDSKGVNWKKRLTDGRMKNVAFVLDPDGESAAAFQAVANANFVAGYWVEIIQNQKLKKTDNW